MTPDSAGLSSTESASETESAETAGDAEPTTESEREPEPLSKDVVFELLKNQRRRDAIRFLEENGEEATLSDMAEHIAAKENDTTVQALSSSQRKRVYIGLYQCHLPKMADAGVIDFEKNRGDIELRPAAEQLDPYLKGDSDETEDVSGPDPATPTRYLALAAVVSVCVAAGLLGVPVFARIPAAGWAVLSTAVLMGLTAVESYRSRTD
jgi:hypothetical protein